MIETDKNDSGSEGETPGSGKPWYPQLLLIKVVVLVVLRALQGYLEGDAILGDLVDPYTLVAAEL